MKTNDWVTTAVAPQEAEAIIEQARRRQRRRRGRHDATPHPSS